MSRSLGPWLRKQRKELVLAAIQGGCRTNAEIMKATGLHKEAVASAAAILKRDGSVWRAPSGWKLKEAPTQER